MSLVLFRIKKNSKETFIDFYLIATYLSGFWDPYQRLWTQINNEFLFPKV